MKNDNMGEARVARAARVNSLDIYKGLAILLVVAGHLAQSGTSEPDRSLLFKGIYMFHMPLFFLVSGMVYSLKPMTMSVAELGDSLVKRTRQLLLPFFTWHILNYVLSGMAVTFPSYMLDLYRSPDLGLWFLWVLFVFSSVADLEKVLTGRSTLLHVLYGVLIWTIFSHLRIHYYVLGLGLIAFHLPFFFAGVFHRQIVGTGKRWAGPVAVASSLAFPFAVYYWERLNPPQIGLLLQQTYSLPMSTLLYTCYLAMGYMYQVMFAAIGIVVFFVGARAFTEKVGAKPWLSRGLCFVGQRTLEIYVLHFYFIRYRYSDAGPLMNGIVAMILATLLSILVADYLLKPNRVAALLLLGKLPGKATA